MSGIKDFFIGAIDTLDDIAGSDTMKLYTDYEKRRRDERLQRDLLDRENDATFDQHDRIMRTERSISDAANQNTLTFQSVTKYVPYGLALLIPLFFFMKR